MIKNIIYKIINFIKEFIKKELKDKKMLYFWIPFKLLAIVCFILFIVFRINLIGWILFIIMFVVLFIFRYKIFKYIFKIQIGIIIGVLIVLSLIFMFTRGSNYSSEVSKTPLEELSYNKEYYIPDDAGSYKINLITNKEDNVYELELYFNSNTSIIPSGFIWDSTKCKTYIREHITVYKVDQLEVFITSSYETKEYYSHGPVSINIDYTGGTGKIRGMFPTRFVMTFYNKESLKNFINKYDTLEVYRYNVGEVGINNFKSEKSDVGDGYIGSYGYNAEKAYKLHPIILSVDINWSDLETDLGL